MEKFLTSVLTSKQNPTVKQVRKLHRAKERRQQNLLLLEGNNTITAAINSNYPLLTVFCTPNWQENHQQLVRKIIEKGQNLQLVSQEVLVTMATTVNPDGVIAIAERQSARTPVVSRTKLGLVVERLQDPGNLGTIVRTAVATNVDGLWLSQDSVDFDHPKLLRASVGEWFRLPMIATADLTSVVRQHQQHQIQVVATVPNAQKTYWDLDLTRPSLLLLGNESGGLSSQLQTLADEKISIPLYNGVESLNVAIATALILYEAQRQNHSSS